MAISITDSTARGVFTHKTYTVQFFTDGYISTTVTHTDTVVTNWINEIKHLHRLPGPIIVGLDVEWRPSFSQRQNPVATLQLCVGNRCLIYQIIHAVHIPQSLANFLSREYDYVTFVGVGVKADLDKLQSGYGIGGGAFYEDLRVAAEAAYGCKELKSAGLQTLASVVLGRDVEMPRAVTVSRWDQWPLTPEQVKYACVDAYLSYQIGRALGV